MEETRGDRLRATENDTPGPVRIPNTIDTANPAGDPTIRPEEDTP